MFKRILMQPDPMKEYYFTDEYGNTYFGHWLVSNTYEGWYIKGFNGAPPRIETQKKLKIISYREPFQGSPVKKYISKKLLDDIFGKSDEIAFMQKID